MFRISMLALIFGFTGIAVFAEDARQLTRSGMMIEPNAMSQSPETVMLTLGPAQKVTLGLGQGVVNARQVSDNKIQLKFRTKDFEGEYFHYTGDLFFIYKIWASDEADVPEARKLGLARAPFAQLPSSPSISCTSITILRRRAALSIRMNAPISLNNKPSESEMKSLISAIDNVLPLEPCGADAFGAPSKKNSTGTCRILDICSNRLAPMRLAPLSYFCTCWKVSPSAAPSFSWLIASIRRRIRTRLPTC